MANDVVHLSCVYWLFIYLLWRKVCRRLLFISIWPVHPFVLSCENSLCMLNASPLSDTWFANIFCNFVGCLLFSWWSFCLIFSSVVFSWTSLHWTLYIYLKMVCFFFVVDSSFWSNYFYTTESFLLLLLSLIPKANSFRDANLLDSFLSFFFLSSLLSPCLFCNMFCLH